MNNTLITNIKGTWCDVVNACRTTVSKPPLGSEPSATFKRDILIAEHSPIRLLYVSWKWQNVKSWIATHWSRHKWECFISTQRDDRTGVSRDELGQGEPVQFEGEANAQHLIDTMRKRLCGQAHKETRVYAEDFKDALYLIEPALSDVLVPNCVYRCGCPEMSMCKELIWVKFKHWCYGKEIKVEELPIKRRYELYNEWFYEVWVKEDAK